MEQVKIIGKRKYEALKQFDLENLTEETLEIFHKQFGNLRLAEAIQMIRTYEEKFHQSEKVKEYFKSLNSSKEDSTRIIKDPKEWLWKRFLKEFHTNEKVNYSIYMTDGSGNKVLDKTSVENLKPLIYYFIGDLENFKNCENVSNISEPSLEKGLLLIGGYGSGKTSVMRAFENALKNFEAKRFKSYSTNEMVTMYESCEKAVDKEEFMKIMVCGRRLFDDVLTERLASNYGKANIVKDVLEERVFKKKLSHITLNYADNTDNDLEKGLEQIGDKYGSRLYDRIWSSFNIVEFKGNSRRK